MTKDKMTDKQKLEMLKALLKAGNGSVSAADLLAKTGTARRARRALFVARKDGMILEAVRTNGRAVTSYVQVVATAAPTATKVAAVPASTDAVTVTADEMKKNTSRTAETVKKGVKPAAAKVA